MRRPGPKPPIVTFEPRDPQAPRVEVHRFSRDRALPGAGLHGHTFFELICVERGGGTHVVGARREQARAGDLYVLPPGEVHDTRGLGGEGRLVLFEADALGGAAANPVALPGDLLLTAFLLAGEGGARLRIATKDRPRWAARLSELERELAGRETGWREAARAILSLVLVDAARLASGRLEHVPANVRPLLAGVFAVIESRWAQPISLADVARAVGRSPAYLTDLVRRETGRTVLSWIIARRMAEARRRLLGTDESIERIAEAVSYVDAGYFVRLFRREHGLPPAAWRRARRG